MLLILVPCTDSPNSLMEALEELVSKQCFVATVPDMDENSMAVPKKQKKRVASFSFTVSSAYLFAV